LTPVLRKGSKSGQKRKQAEQTSPADQGVQVFGKASRLGAGDLVNSAVGVSGEDLTSVLLAVQSASTEVARAQRTYGSSIVSQIKGRPPRTSLIDYPTILARLDEVELSADQLLEEIELLLEMGGPASPESPMLYSLRIVEPARWVWPPDGPSASAIGLTPGRIAELEVGFFHYDVLYGLTAVERAALLAQILATASTVDVNVSVTGQLPVRTRVILKAD
jgi:hypothetical protein